MKNKTLKLLLVVSIVTILLGSSISGITLCEERCIHRYYRCYARCAAMEDRLGFPMPDCYIGCQIEGEVCVIMCTM